MEPKHAQQIGKLLPLEKDDLDFFLSKFRPVSLKKGEHFIKEGEISRKVGFILSGSMLCSYNKDGNEIIDEFSLNQEFITDYYSLLTNTPAEKDVRCLEDTELMVIDKKDLEVLYATKPVYEKVGRIMAEALFMKWQQKAKSLILDDAETRYLKLIQRRPDLPQSVPQYLIASYLGVKPETLSRIRKRITKQP